MKPKKQVNLLQLFITLVCSLIFNNGVFSQNRVVKEVYDVKEFFQALDNNTEIFVKTDTLNFTISNLVNNYKVKKYKFKGLNTPAKQRKTYFVEEDGLVLYGYENLKITSPNKVRIISNNQYEDIITFINCNKLYLENLSIHHTGLTCNGRVLSIALSKNIEIKKCSLNGSGAIGAYMIGSVNITFKNVNVFNNAFHATSSINSYNIKFIDSNFYKNNSYFDDDLILTHFSSLSFENCNFYENDSSDLYNHNNDIKDYVVALEEGDNFKYYENEKENNFDIKRFKPQFENCVFNENKFSYKEKEEVETKDNSIIQKVILELFFNKLVNIIDEIFEPNEIYELMSFLEKENIFLLKDKFNTQKKLIDFFNDYRVNPEYGIFDEFESVGLIKSISKNIYLVEINALYKKEQIKVRWTVMLNGKNRIIKIVQN